MTRRYYSRMPIGGSQLVLDGPEAHHLIHVMRASVGDKITVFDGSGRECSAAVLDLGRRQVTLRVEAPREIDRELYPPLALAVVLPKGDRQRWLIEKCVELGVAQLWPIVTRHTEQNARAAGSEKLDRYVIEASKQCGRNRLLVVRPPRSWHELLEADWTNHARLIATTAVEAPLPRPLGDRPAVVAIGPEAGFTPDELEAGWARGWLPLSFGPRTLRIETAALAAAAWWQLWQLQASSD